MDLFNLWPMNSTGQDTAEEAARRRAARWDEPAPVPAQLLAGMAHPFTHFNRPGEDPINQGIELGMAGISPFRGRMTTARPAMTPQEALWGRAQSGDIHARGQLTGEMFQRDLAELPGPPAPEPALPGDLPRTWHRGSEPTSGYDPMGLHPLFDISDAQYSRGRDAYGFPHPFTNEVHGDSYWTGERWQKKQPRQGPNQPDEGMIPRDERGFQYDPADFPDEPIPPTPERLNQIYDDIAAQHKKLADDYEIQRIRREEQGIPPDWDIEKQAFREGMDYLPPEGSVPPQGYPDPRDPSIIHPGEPPEGPFDEEFMKYLNAGPEPGVPYEEWQQMLRKLNVSPNVLPRINPFGGRSPPGRQ